MSFVKRLAGKYIRKVDERNRIALPTIFTSNIENEGFFAEREGGENSSCSPHSRRSF